MSVDTPEFVLPKHLDEIDARFMTEALRASGHIAATDAVVTQEECGVGMTAGYFSAIKKVKCAFREAKGVQDLFVVKAWPPFEILPREAIEAMFARTSRPTPSRGPASTRARRRTSPSSTTPTTAGR